MPANPVSLVSKQGTHPPQELPSEPITIPKASFTAFRLAHSPANEVSELSTSVFLGRIPDVWVGGPHTNFVFDAVSRARKKVKRRFKSASLAVSQSVRWFQTRPDLQSDEERTIEEDGDTDFNFFHRKNHGMEEKFREAYAMEENLEENEAEKMFLGGAGDVSRERLQSEQLPGSSASFQLNGARDHDHDSESDEDAFEGEFVLNRRLDTDAASLETWDSAASPSLRSFLPIPEYLRKLHDSKLPSIMVAPNEPVDSPQFEPIGKIPLRALFRASVNTSPPRSTASSVLSPSSLGDQRVKFNVERIMSRRSKMSFAAPQPAQTQIQGFLDAQYVKAEKDHNRMRERLRVLAAKSTGRARTAGSKFKLKMIDTIMASYKAGEVIRVDRMLVLIEKSLSKRLVVHNEGELGDTRVLDRWREYYTVLRKTKTLRLEIQLFDVSDSLDFDGKPEQTILLTDHLKADFYSLSDKTISLVEKVDDGTMLYTFCAKYATSAYKWLFIIKELTHDTMVPMINVKIEGLNMQFEIDVPKHVLRTSMTPPKELTLVQEEKGYHIQHGEILEYIRVKLLNSLEESRHKLQDVDLWLKNNPQPWFCFKIYDRLEWVAINSRVFFIQSQLHSSTSVLEFRQVSRTPRISQTQEGENLERPHPCEGFLARVTNISGSEFSNLRPFYRVQYFYTAEGILFFSQIFKATPPSPENEFINEDADREEVRDKLPELFYKIPFPLDSGDHVPWLNSPDFEKYDRQAVEEFERKVQQVIKSDAMIDLTSVKEVKALPLESIIAHHRYIQSFLWYSAPHIIEEEDIIDCAFEIVLVNGSRLKLMAPSKMIRDEWVTRLTAHTKFWKSVKTEDVLTQVDVRKTNSTTLGVSEYVDSNITNQTKELEMKLAIGNARLFNTSAYAMATPVLASGYLYLKYKKHANFNQYFVVLCPGHVVIFTLFQRSKITGMWKKTPYFQHYLTLQLSQCYIYAGATTWQDLVESSDFTAPGKNDLPRSYSDGWKSSEEDTQRCFTLWFGTKRKLCHGSETDTEFQKRMGDRAIQNPGLATMVRKLGMTGKKIVFLARSRQEREEWVYKILTEINRFSRG